MLDYFKLSSNFTQRNVMLSTSVCGDILEKVLLI